MRTFILFVSILLCCSCSRSGKFRSTEIQAKEIFGISELPEGYTAPTFQDGGVDEYRKWVMRNHLNYPKTAFIHGISGKVTASFLVDADGRIKDIQIVESPHDILGKEVIHMLKRPAVWEPGKNSEGIPIGVRYVIPVEFHIHSGNSGNRQ